jgi:hypothetical protein
MNISCIPATLVVRMKNVIHGAALIVAAGCSFLLAATRLTANNYRCGDPSTNHCYARVLWEERPQYFGAYTDITQVAMSCPSDCGGFVNDEIWLVDTKSRDCQTSEFQMCWVEAGTFAQPDGRYFFWAEGRPLKTNAYNQHILGPGDPEGVVNHYMMIQDARGDSGISQIWIYNDSLSTLYNGTSTNNAMSGNQMHIGQELAGTQNASAGFATFSRNIFAVQALGQEYVFWYNAQTTRGNTRIDNPPSGGWVVDPGKPPPEGGQFSTRCCS